MTSVRARVSTGLRQWQWWRTLRRIQAEGPSEAFLRWRQWSGVLNTAPVRTDVPGSGPIEVHLLCHRGDYLCAIWALKSLCLTSGVRWPVVIHLQGRVTSTMRRRLRRHLPDARLIEQDAADAAVRQALASDYPRLLEARRQSPFMMKLVDPVLLTKAERIVVLDSDVLFFRDPQELRAHAEGASNGSWVFQRDPISTYNVTEAEARSAFGIALPDCVNSGIAVIPRSLVDLRLCERLLEHPDVRRPSGWIEQTLFALCAGARGDVTYLSSSYVISLERGLDYDALTARHYAGPSRPLLTEEGMPYAALQGCLG
ncbi:MAG TPA: hypothetical protein VI485_05090 [Vicinamibacterales bacterium]|nr:hypothetical protein [Vicinamibacterales bacterium]